MKYVILIHSNPTSRQVFDTWTPEQQNQFSRDHMTLGADLAASGELVHSEGLVGPTESKWVHVEGRDIITTDGPYAETKEYLAGFYVVDCDSIDRAVQHAARLPEAAYTHVEVRPVWDPRILDDLA
jgi:hypothetical protein